ncbi:MAG TPA: HAMP domain-containing sensor histidine kinase [Acidimicrobiales bacterium]|nr:HAMP domain-containing sensor histidine kinase [Acidimicrobiales bacterium]
MRWRLAAALVGVVAMVLVVQDVPLAFHLERVERDRLETGLERDAHVLAGQSEDVLEGRAGAASAGLDDVVSGYAARSGATVVVTDAAATAVASSDQGAVGASYANRPEVAAAVEGRFASGERGSRTLGEPLVYVAVPVRSGAEVLGAVRLTYPARVIDERVADRLRGLVLAAAVSVAAAVVVAVVLASWVVRPLARLRAAADGMATGDLATRAATDAGPPEVRALGASFDAMADRLERMVEGQRGFAADASHQLRTPLTALRLRLDQAAELVEGDPAAARDRLDAARAEIDRLARLTEGLLALARADGAGAATTVVDVAAVARDRADGWRPLAEERGVHLVVDTPASTPARAVPGAVEQIVDGYLDNALDVTPPGSTLRVAVEHDGPSVVLHVVDEGPGLDADQRARAFDRFWQAGGARRGSGLGLAIARQLATAGGGRVELRPGPTGGIDAVAVLPAARATRPPSRRGGLPGAG